MGRRTIPNTTKARAVGRAAVIGIRGAAREAGVSPSTMHGWWRDPKYRTFADAKNDEIADAYQIGILAGLARLMEIIPKAEDVGKVAVAVGVLHDKRALLLGAATSRTESRDITGTLSDVDLIEAIREAERITGAGRAAEEVEAPAEGSGL